MFIHWVASAGGGSGTVTSVVAGTGLTGGTITTTGTVAIDNTVVDTLSGNQTISGTKSFTAAPNVTITGIGTGQTTGLELKNTTAAALGAQQYSPSLVLTGQGWQTNTGGSQTTNFLLLNRPIQGAANPTTELVIYEQINGGGYVERYKFDSTNTMTFNAPSGTTGGILKGGNGSLTMNDSVGSQLAYSSSNILVDSANVTITPASAACILANAIRFSSRQTVADTAATVSATAAFVAFTSISAARVLTGPSATAGRILIIKDESGSASATNTITFTPASGNIDGSASKVVVNSAFGVGRVYSNGTNWFTF